MSEEQLKTLKLTGESALDDQDSSDLDSEAESPTYTYINSRSSLEKLQSHLSSILSTPNPWQAPHIFLSCQGRDLGCQGGKLGLLGLGIKDEIYLLDVLTYSRGLDVLKEILENEGVEKVIWDSRGTGSELWHGHEICVSNVVDLQLVKVYEKEGGRARTRPGALRIQDLKSAFEELEASARNELGVDIKRMELLHQEITRKQPADKDLWIRRPLKSTLLDHTTYQILQLRTLYTHFLPTLSQLPFLTLESLRYCELYHEARPPANAWYLNHHFLPQEILERTEEVRVRVDGLGRRVCAVCRRALHQDSFRDSFARRWTLRLGEHGKMCYTCAAARRTSEATQAAKGGPSTSNPMKAKGGPPSPTTP